MCRSDERRLLNIEKTVSEFHKQCQKSLIAVGKRCNPDSTINNNPQKNKKCRSVLSNSHEGDSFVSDALLI